MNNYKLNVWTHPASGEKRIYINGGLIAQGDKVFVTADVDDSVKGVLFMAAGSYGSGYRSAFGSGSKSDWALEIAERAFDMRILGATKFAELLAKVEG